MEEIDNTIINQDYDSKSFSTIQKVLILQRLLKEWTAKKKMFIDNKEKMISKIDKKCYQYFEGRIKVKKAFDYILNDDIKITNRNYILKKEKINTNDDLEKSIYNFYFLLQNDNSLMLKLIELCQNRYYEELSDFFVHFLYVNIINFSFAEDQLFLMIYLLLEKLIIQNLPYILKSNNEEPITYLKDTFLFYVFKSLTRKIDLRKYLGNILNSHILRLENLRLTLSTDISKVNKIVNLRNAFIYRNFFESIGSLKDSQIHKRKQKFKGSKSGDTNINNLNKGNFGLKRAKKIEIGTSIIQSEENDYDIIDKKMNEKKDEKNNNEKDVLDEYEIIDDKGNIIENEEKPTTIFKKRTTKVEENDKKDEKEDNKKENKININFENLKLGKKSISDYNNNKNINENKNKLNFSLNISKGTSDIITKTQLSMNVNNGKIPLDIFFNDIDVTKKKLSELREEYDKREFNDINFAMKCYLDNLISQIPEKKNNKINKKVDINKDNNKNDDGEIFSSSLFNEELYMIGQIKSNDNFYQLMKKIKINHRIISKIINNIINEISKNLASFPYSIKCIFKIINELLKKKYLTEEPYDMDTYQGYLFKMNFLIGNIILPIIKDPNYNGIISNDIISDITKENLKIISSIFEKMITGQLFTKKENSSMTLYNLFIIETLPKLFELMNNFGKSIELPNYIDKLIKCHYSERKINYDYFKEDQNESIQFQSICSSLNNLYIFINIIGMNKETLIDNNANQEQKKVLNNLVSKSEIIINKYLNEQQGNNREFFYMTKVLYSDKFKNEIDNICKDNFFGTVPINEKDLIVSYKKCLVEVLNYANKIQYENFYDLTELKNEKTMKKIKSKMVKKEEEKNNQIKKPKNRCIKSLKVSLIKIIESKKEDDVDFKKIIFPHIKKNILFEMNSEMNDTLSQRIVYCTNYLHLYMRNLPNKYIENNYSLLFDELVIETKNNIKLLWTNILFEYFKKIKEAERVNMNAKEFNSQIKDLENLFYTEYLYKKLLLPGDFEIEKNKNNIISFLKYKNSNSEKNNTGFIILDDSKDKTIGEMVNDFPDFREYENDYDNILEIEEKANIPETLNKYLSYMGKQAEKEDYIRNMKKDELESIKCLLENYVINKLYDKLFPSEISEEDLFIYKKCERLSFIKPENIMKKKGLISENLLNESIKIFEQFDNKLTPLDKLKCIEKGFSIIENSIKFSSGQKDCGFDDFINPVLYILIKAKPKNFSTNVQYCNLYMTNLIPKKYEKLCADLSFYVEAIKEMKHTQLIGVSEEQFGKDEFALEPNEKKP